MTLMRWRNGSFDALSSQIIGAAIEVHRHLGPGLLESAYEICLAEELSLRGIGFERQVALPAVYRGRVLDFGYRIDFVIGNIAVEIKSVESILPVHRAQLVTYLRLKKLPIGLLLNFQVTALRDGIVRVINDP
jgi:GxxExxY protein